MEYRDLEEGDVLQLNPKLPFGGMLLVVTDPKQWGAQGYLCSSRSFEATKYIGRTFVRVKFADMEYIGRLEWLEMDKAEEEGADDDS